VRCSLAHFRSHVLQVLEVDHMDLERTWPSARWVDEDQLFFVDHGQEQDCSALKLRLRYANGTDGHRVSLDLECFFYAIGWASPLWDALQCSLVNYEDFKGAVDGVQSHLLAWGPTTDHALIALKRWRVPKSNSVIFAVPEISARVVVSFKVTYVHDEELCQSAFPRVEFSCDIANEKDLPQVHHE